MTTNIVEMRKQDFMNSWQTWAVMHHFLPASLARELSEIIVEVLSSGALELSSLFDDQVSGPLHLSVWEIKPRGVESDLGRYLQYRIRAFGWNNDPEISFSPELNRPDGLPGPAQLEHALRLGRLDLQYEGDFESLSKAAGESNISCFVQAFNVARECIAEKSQVRAAELVKSKFEQLPAALRITALKHFGDLFEDIGRHDISLELYSTVYTLCRAQVEEPWREYVDLLRQVAAQSIATATYAVYGADASAKLLSTQLDDASLSSAPLLFANATHDQLVMRTNGDSEDMVFPIDHRATQLFPPLLLKTQELHEAFASELTGNFENAHRHYWAVLRRQIALGSNVEARSTRGFFARSIINELMLTGSTSQHGAFRLALRLFIESASKEALELITWDHRIVRTYVDLPTVKFLIEEVKRYSGVERERCFVIISMFSAWAPLLDVTQHEVAALMISFVVDLATKSKAAFRTSANLLSPCLKALEEIARLRLDLLRNALPEIAVLLAAKIVDDSGFWTGTRDALSTAEACIDEWEHADLKTVVTAILQRLTAVSASDNRGSPYIDLALSILWSGAVKELVKEEAQVGTRVMSALVNFGLNEQSQNAQFLARLDDFPVELVVDESVRQRLDKVVELVRERALSANSSAAAGSIQALLLAPNASGRAGIKDALRGLKLVIERATQNASASPSFAASHVALFVMSQKLTEISTLAGIPLQELICDYKEIEVCLLQLWGEAQKNPKVFSSFSFTRPADPDKAVVHNWALGTIVLAEVTGAQSLAQSVLAQARGIDGLQEGIDLARATQMASSQDTISNDDIFAIAGTGRDAFYLALGRHLVSLSLCSTKEKAQALCRVLLDQCLRFGPREIDTSILFAGLVNGLEKDVNADALRSYVGRTKANPALRLLLLPALEMYLKDSGNKR